MSDKTLMEKIKEGRQYRSMILEARNAENEDKSYIVEGYALTFDEGYKLYSGDGWEVREKILPEALTECDTSDVIMQYDHEGHVYARISNKTLALLPDEHGLFIRADLSGTEGGRQLYEEIAGGYTTKMSFAFTVAEDSEEEFTEDGKRIYLRTIKKLSKIYDVSAVSLPANDGTEISARNYCDGVIAKFEAERLKEAEEKRNAEEMEKRLRKQKQALSLVKGD